MASRVPTQLRSLHSLAGQAPAAPRLYYGCAVYVSEARDSALVQRLEHLARQASGACLANLFVDEPYNRSNLTLVGTSVPALTDAVVSLARAALDLLDLRQHAATHPRLGTVDHISCHPLQPHQEQQQQQEDVKQQQQQEAAELAVTIAQQLGAGPQALPVFTYGWAHPQQRPLDALRRQLGYFQGAAGGSWQGTLQPVPAAAAAAHAQHQAQQQAVQPGQVPAAALALPIVPCYGPAAAPTRSGVCCVGAAPWIVNYNILLPGCNDMAAARAIARAVSERGGGLRSVQAMALRHTHGIEVACNLLNPEVSPPEAVLAAVRQLAAQHGVEMGAAYRTNKAPEELVAAAVAQGL